MASRTGSFSQGKLPYEFRSTKLGSTLSSFSPFLAKRNMSAESSLLNTDASKPAAKFYHRSALVLAALTPVAFIMPSWVNLPIDLTLGVLFPVHSHIALNYVISDYVPKAIRTTARVTLFGATVVTLMGILKLNLAGPGLTQTLTALWRGKKTEKKAAIKSKH